MSQVISISKSLQEGDEVEIRTDDEGFAATTTHAVNIAFLSDPRHDLFDGTASIDEEFDLPRHQNVSFPEALDHLHSEEDLDFLDDGESWSTAPTFLVLPIPRIVEVPMRNTTMNDSTEATETATSYSHEAETEVSTASLSLPSATGRMNGFCMEESSEEGGQASAPHLMVGQRNQPSIPNSRLTLRKNREDPLASKKVEKIRLSVSPPLDGCEMRSAIDPPATDSSILLLRSICRQNSLRSCSNHSQDPPGSLLDESSSLSPPCRLESTSSSSLKNSNNGSYYLSQMNYWKDRIGYMELQLLKRRRLVCALEQRLTHQYTGDHHIIETIGKQNGVLERQPVDPLSVLVKQNKQQVFEELQEQLQFVPTGHNVCAEARGLAVEHESCNGLDDDLMKITNVKGNLDSWRDIEDFPAAASLSRFARESLAGLDDTESLYQEEDEWTECTIEDDLSEMWEEETVMETPTEQEHIPPIPMSSGEYTECTIEEDKDDAVSRDFPYISIYLDSDASQDGSVRYVSSTNTSITMDYDEAREMLIDDSSCKNTQDLSDDSEEVTNERIATLLRSDLCSSNTDTVHSALQELAREVSKNRCSRQFTVRFGGLLAIFSAMEANQNSREIQIAACEAIERLAVTEEIESAVCQVGGIKTMISTLQDHDHDAKVQTVVLSALLCLPKRAPARHLNIEGIVKVVVLAMKRHRNKPRLQEKAFRFLSTICLNNHDHLCQLPQTNGLLVMTLALQTPWDDASEQQEAISQLSILLRCLALTTLTCPLDESTHASCSMNDLYMHSGNGSALVAV